LICTNFSWIVSTQHYYSKITFLFSIQKAEFSSIDGEIKGSLNETSLKLDSIQLFAPLDFIFECYIIIFLQPFNQFLFLSIIRLINKL
jgi:hypothetical protein